ncbi:F-box/LRR-repeat protein 4 [Neocloeon triangulifer]|uniref:F-box/LRR-repeat protein 4 n=1 Tax=Neocloeon triangulifer TaxID=2078957 RepID=UPI00286F87A2|nr:F-box/LRR-repeat protein 4 [Neocloeon triangulifer]
MLVRPKPSTLSWEKQDDTGKYLIKQHAQDVVDFSSQYGSVDSISYTAHNLTGQSRVFPAYGDHAEAYSMRTYGKWWDEAPSGRKEIQGQNFCQVRSQDFIDLSFEHKVFPSAVTLFEVYNPGALVRVWARDANIAWCLLYQVDQLESAPLVARKFSPKLKECHFPTSLLRLEFNHEHLDSYYEVESFILEGFTRQWKNPLATYEPYGEITKKVLNLNLTQILSRSDSSSSSSFSETSSPLNTSIDEDEEDELNAFETLPYEVVHKIFSYLDLKSLCQCCIVSKQFQAVAKDSTLYVHVNLKNYWNIVNDSTLQCIAFRCSRLQSLDLSWCNGKGSFEMAFIKLISHCGATLKILRLNSCKFITKYCLAEIADTCCRLEELSLRKILPPYKSLTGWQVLSELTTLKYLDLYHVHINTQDLMSFLPYLTKLQHLNLGSCAASRLTLLNMDVIAESLSRNNKNLKSVDMWRSHLSLSSIGIKCLSKCSQLEEVDLGWAEIEALGDCIQDLAKGCPRLKKFFVPAMRGLTDRDLHVLINNCPLLEQVDILGIRNVSPDVCVRMLTHCRNLCLLDVSYCDKISRAHVSLWRVQFPHISIKQCSYSRPDAIDNFV